ncbi:MAG: ribonuclease III [Coprococcus sp.]|nr:ribonuclease III [Coprococcus sp.]
MKDLSNLENRIGYIFNNKELLVTALTHTSFANEVKVKGIESYERTEFLGDAILEFIVSEFLFVNKKEYEEGRLTKLRASLVCEFTLSQISESLGYGEYVRLSKGEQQTGGRSRRSILCDLFESVLGAIYLDGGMEPAKRFVHRFLLDDIDTKSLFYDAKTQLQEYCQRQGVKLEYKLISENGPEHSKMFVSEAYVGGAPTAVGEGTNRKASEQMAAYKALLQLMKKQG